MRIPFTTRVLAVVLALAGCGGSSSPLSKTAYSAKLQQVGTSLVAALNSLGRRSSEFKRIETHVGTGQAALRRAAARLAAVTPTRRRPRRQHEARLRDARLRNGARGSEEGGGTARPRSRHRRRPCHGSLTRRQGNDGRCSGPPAQGLQARATRSEREGLNSRPGSMPGIRLFALSSTRPRTGSGWRRGRRRARSRRVGAARSGFPAGRPRGRQRG